MSGAEEPLSEIPLDETEPPPGDDTPKPTDDHVAEESSTKLPEGGEDPGSEEHAPTEKTNVPDIELLSEIDALTKGSGDDASEEKSPRQTDSVLLLEQVQALEKDRGQLTSEVLEKDTLIGKLEKEIASLKAENAQKDEAFKNLTDDSARKYQQLHEETTSKINELKRQFTQANREKESMVVKYAMGEKAVILQRRAKEETEKQLKAAQKEKEDLTNKISVISTDRTRLQHIADSRLQELNVAKKDIERWMEEVKCQESKASVSASRLRAEVDAHRETREQLDATIKHLAETRKEIDSTRKECQDFMQRFKDTEDAKVQKASLAVKEQSVKLMIDEAASKELGTLRTKYQSVIEENNNFSIKIQKMETERLQYEGNLSKLKEVITGQKQEIDDLLSQVAEMESLRMQLQRAEEKYEARSGEVERLRTEATDLKSDMASCRTKEAELLQFTQKLTDKNVTLQSEFAALEAKASALEAEHSKLVAKVSNLETNYGEVSVELTEEKKKRTTETQLLAVKLAEKTKLAESLGQRVVDAENEVQVLKRRNASSLKELTRELQACKKRLEDKARSQGSPSVLSQSSRASSNSSLNRLVEDPDVSGGSSRSLSVCNEPNGNSSQLQRSEFVPPLSSTTQIPDTQILVEKIVKLQRTLAKRQEKIDFHEEHLATLTDEVKRKNKIIQNYVMKQEPGALSSSDMDENKPAVIRKVHDIQNERRAAEHGGIMASLYSSKPSDSSMTLDLSLEINRKLQAVLEDTLLKNITLKENINTLANEIATLSAKSYKK